jgi:hypothetical protein
MTPLPSLFSQARNCLLQLTGTICVLLRWVASALLGVGDEEGLHAVSPMTAAPAAARASRFM